MKETVKFNGKSIDYFKFGNGGKVFVIIPGLSVKSVTESERAIVKDYKIFENDYTAYCFDRINEMSNTYSISEMAEDYIEAFDALGIKDAYVFGASQGGMIAQRIAMKRKDLIRKMVLGSSAPSIDINQFKHIEELIKLAEEKKREELFSTFAIAIYPEEFYEKYKLAFTFISKTVTDNELKRFITCAKALKNFDVFDKLSEIKCDTLFISDKTDKLIGDISGAINGLKLDNVKAICLDGYGHAAYDIAPNYKEIIYKYFEKSEI